jgi:hypothetical protein
MSVGGRDDAKGGFERTECLSSLACDIEENGGALEGGFYPVPFCNWLMSAQIEPQSFRRVPLDGSDDSPCPSPASTVSSSGRERHRDPHERRSK